MFFPLNINRQAGCYSYNVTVLNLKCGATLNLSNYCNIKYSIKIITTNNVSRDCQNVPWGANHSWLTATVPLTH